MLDADSEVDTDSDVETWIQTLMLTQMPTDSDVDTDSDAETIHVEPIRG